MTKKKKAVAEKASTKKDAGDVHQEAVLSDYEACVAAQLKQDKEDKKREGA